MRQMATAIVCLDPAKSALFHILVLSTAGFDHLLLALSAICHCPSGSKD